MRRSLLAAVLSLLCLAASAYAESVNIGYLLAPRAFRAAVEKVKPYMVTIDTVGGIALTNSKKQRQQMGGPARPGEGPTTGLIISADGYIVTSTFNFIRKPRIITVELPDGTQKVAKLLGRDDTRKICLLKVEGVQNLPMPRFVDPDDLRVGQWAISVGVGYGGEEPAVSAGILSALYRIGGRAVQTDANLSPANYGGPLIDIEGRILGICVPMNPRGGGVGSGAEWYDSGIGFAVTMYDTQRLIDRMKEGEHLKRGLVGVLPSPKSIEGGGVKVTKVLPGSPADKAGLKDNDIITHISGEPVDGISELRKELGRFVADEEIQVTYKRGEEVPVQVALTLETGPFKAPPKPKKPEVKAGEGDDPAPPGADGESEEPNESPQPQPDQPGEEESEDPGGE